VSGVLRPRLVLTGVLVAVGTFLLFCWGLTIGDYPVAFTDVVRALGGAGDPGTVIVVQDLRLPRALTGLLVGIAFGVSGAVFQTMTRNPLASPDMIGLTEGAGTAVVAAVVLGWTGGLGLSTLGLLGALATALLVYALAWKGGATGYRIILVGIGVSWICTSATDFLVARGNRFEAQEAIGWLVGNLNGRTWDQVDSLALAMAVLLPVTLGMGRWMRTLMLGDDVAAGLGTPVQSVRLALLLTGVGLVAFGTAAAARLRSHRRVRRPRLRPPRTRGDPRDGTAGRDRHRRPRRAGPAVAAHPRQPRGLWRLIACRPPTRVPRGRPTRRPAPASRVPSDSAPAHRDRTDPAPLTRPLPGPSCGPGTCISPTTDGPWWRIWTSPCRPAASRPSSGPTPVANRPCCARSPGC
jgi:ABC-type enterobactin transport system permease subunit